MNLTKNRPVFRMTLIALCLALYVVLSTFTPETQFFKFTLDGIPLLFIAIAAGPVDGMVVGALGGFLNDLLAGALGTGYGLSLTTPLWMIPAVVRALIVGLIMKNKNLSEHKITWVLTVILTGFLTTALNSGIMILDGIIMGYSATLTVLMICIRAAATVASSILYIIIIPPLIKAVSKNANK